MELPSKIKQQIAFNTKPEIEEHMLIVMGKNTHEEHLFQPLQTSINQFKIAITFLSGCNGIFNVTNSKIKFSLIKSITDEDGYIQLSIPPGDYERESLNNENKRIIIDEGLFTELDYPFSITPNFSTLGSIIEITTQGQVITFIPNGSIRDPLGFKKTTIYEE